MNYSTYKILLFDLDGTLLNSEKHISDRTAQAVRKCQEKGIKIGICTSRSEANCQAFIDKINPDVTISSGGALIKIDGQYIFKHEFSVEETRTIIRQIRELIGAECEITIDTENANYWNYKIDPNQQEANWGKSIYSDFRNITSPSLKICAEIKDINKVSDFYACFDQYDCIHFSDGDWYKITKKNITKENAIREMGMYYGFGLEEVISFGDDIADIGMLNMSGLGIAMGNALDEVKAFADIVIGDNDKDGIAVFIEQNILSLD